MSQNTWSDHSRAFLLSADVPGVNVLLSPALLNAPACCCALPIVVTFVPHSAASHWPNAAVPPEGTLPNADAFNSAASSCWSSCSRFCPSDERFLFVVVEEIELQNPPISWFFPATPSTAETGWPQISWSPIPATAATPGKVWPDLVPPSQAICASCGCVAQKPCVRVAPTPVFSNVQVTVSPSWRLMVAVCVSSDPEPVLPPLPVVTHAYGVVGSLDPPMPVTVQPSCMPSLTV